MGATSTEEIAEKREKENKLLFFSIYASLRMIQANYSQLNYG